MRHDAPRLSHCQFIFHRGKRVCVCRVSSDFDDDIFLLCFNDILQRIYFLQRFLYVYAFFLV